MTERTLRFRESVTDAPIDCPDGHGTTDETVGDVIEDGRVVGVAYYCSLAGHVVVIEGEPE